MHKSMDMSKPVLTFRNFTKLPQKDLLYILEKRNSPDIRNKMTNTTIISRENHLSFCKSLRNNPTKLYFAVYLNNAIIGVIDFQNINYDKHTYEPGSYFFDSPSIVRSHAVSASGFVRLEKKLYYPQIVVKKDNIQALLFNTMKMGAQIESEDENYYYLKSSVLDEKTPQSFDVMKYDIEN